VKENKWEYSAPRITTSHWTEQGFDGEYVRDMEYFLKQMKGRTIELRSGKSNIRQHIGLSGGFEDDNEDTVLLHDDILLPHWEEIANALQLYHNSSRLLHLSIRDVQLTSPVMDLLASSLKGKAILKIFDLINNEFDNVREGIEFVAKLVEDNPNLEQFYWINNDIERMEDACYLVDAIINHPRVQHVRLENCFGEEDINGYDVFRILFTSGKSFSHIDLENNNIRTGGGTAISDYLATNPPLKEFYLSNNHLNNDDAILIARALKQNTNLQHLHLGDHNIDIIGCNELSNAIYDSTSLNSMADCNHTCTVTGVATPVYIPMNHLNITPMDRRAKKIYHLLSLRNREGSNVQHLNSEFYDEDDDSLVLVPKYWRVYTVIQGVRTVFQGSDSTESRLTPCIHFQLCMKYCVVGRCQNCTRVITILSGWRTFTLEKIIFWPKLKGSCVEMKKHQPPTTTLDFEPWRSMVDVIRRRRRLNHGIQPPYSRIVFIDSITSPCILRTSTYAKN